MFVLIFCSYFYFFDLMESEAMFGFVKESLLVKAEQEIITLKKEIADVTSNSVQLYNELKDALNKSSQEKEEMAEVCTNVLLLKKKLDQDLLNKDALKADMGMLENEQNICERELESLNKKELSEARNNISLLKKELDGVCTHISEIKKERNQALIKVNSLKTSIARIRSEQSEVNRPIENNIANLKVEKLNLICEELKNEVDVLKVENESANQRLSELTDNRGEVINDLIRKKDQLEKSVSKLNEEQTNLISEVLPLKKKLQELNNENENFELLASVAAIGKLIDGQPSEYIKIKINELKEQQKNLIKSSQSFIIVSELLYNNSLSQGKACQKRNGIFMVMSFNAEVDNIIRNVTARNLTSSANKIEKWFNKVNKGNRDNLVRLNRALLDYRLKELSYTFEYHLKCEMEIDEQRYTKECMKEEAKVKKEIESFVTDREKEEKNYQQELNKALSEIETVNKEQVDKLRAHITELKVKLERATTEKERALSMAQLTRSGYVYIISNKGAFGDGVYKIGMTRRLEPMDRVKELGDASVPFFFDVHAIIPSDDAPTLENKLHKRFEQKRLNKVNLRKEFFNVTINDIEKALIDFGIENVVLKKHAPALQFEESQILTIEGR